MESGLLNAFHDDQYDDTYVKFDVENNFWSDENNGTLGLQLSETLHGILPTDEKQHIYFSDDIETQYSIELQNDLAQDIYGIHNIEENIIRTDNVMSSSSPSIEIIPVDPNCDYINSPLDDDENSDFDDDDDDTESNSSEENQIRSCSRLTFRSRTDSSSIGDYESHSSDESDFTDSDNDEYDNKLIVDNQPIFDFNSIINNNTQIIEKNIIIPEEKKLNNNYTIIKKNIYNQCGGISKIQKQNDCDLITDNIDTKNFDLAKFITEDDYLTEDLLVTTINKNKINTSNKLIKNDNNIFNNDDSDIDVDIETVNDCEKINYINNSNLNNNVKLNEYLKHNNTNKLHMNDNINKDPSWNPLSKGTNKCKNLPKNNKQRSIGIRKIQSKFSETIKRNQAIAKKLPQKQFGIGRGGKNISMCTINKECSSEEEDEEIKINEQITANNNDNNKTNKIIINSKSINNLLKIEIETNNLSTTNINDNEIINQSTINNDLSNINQFDIVKPVKRKLNLEEYYKKRRENSLLLNNIDNSSDSSNSIKIYPTTQIKNNINSIIEQPQLLSSSNLYNSNKQKSIHNNCNNINKITSIQNQIKPNESLLKKSIQKINKNITAADPITEAKNKVLRMQELKKKAAQKRLIDFTVSAKVGPITKILPLEEIVNTKSKLLYNNNNDDTEQNKLNNELLDEIIVVSVSCNTDIKIPPTLKTKTLSMTDNNCNLNNNLTKSTELLYNISNTIQKVTGTDNMKISNSSLISSIQNVVFKKTVVAASENGILKLPQIKNNNNKLKPTENIENKSIINEKNGQQIIEEHGEDKIIMHLPKNRPRKLTQSISTQTNILPEFPPLELIYLINNNNKLKHRKYRSKHTKYSSDDDDDEDNYNYKQDYRSPSRSQHHYGDTSSIYKNNGINSTATSSSESSDRDRRSRDRNRRIYSTSPSRSERSHSSSSSSCNSNKSSRSRNRWKKRKSRSRSRSTSRSRYGYSSRCENRRQNRQPSPAVEERRIVYVGRIEDDTSKEDLKRKFLSYGSIKQITLHYKDTGMKYGFVTFEKAEDAFKAIDNGMRDSKINMYDISFGGRRAFCRATYSDLDGAATNTFQTYSYPSLASSQNRNNNVNNNNQDDSFEALLQKMKEKLCNTKNTIAGASSSSVKT